MKKYMDTLDGNSKFVKFIEDKGKDYSSLTTEEKLKRSKNIPNLLRRIKRKNFINNLTVKS